MKVVVTSIFRDKFTGQLYNPGGVIEFEDESRVEDLVNRGLAEVIEVKAPKEDAKISLFEQEFEKRALVDALKTVGEKATMNMKEETLIANVTALDEEGLAKLKEALGI